MCFCFQNGNPDGIEYVTVSFDGQKGDYLVFEAIPLSGDQPVVLKKLDVKACVEQRKGNKILNDPYWEGSGLI